MDAEITGIGWVTAAGIGLGSEHQRFAMPAGKLPEINPADMFKKPYPNFRRMDEYSRLGLTATALALIDAGLSEWTRERDIGIIASTYYGCLGTDVDYYKTVIPQKGAHASPALFSYTLANGFLGEAAIRFGLTGINYVVTEQRPTGLAGLQTAMDHLTRGVAEKILGGDCDVGCPPIFGEPAKVPPGAVFFMLEKSPKRERSSYGRLQLNGAGDLRLDGSEIKDLTDLANKCIRNP
ncbi:MAG: beta-ketoacyl synthase N-terminal-like domain-containing protein [Desulfobacterales bacterium]